MTQEKLIDAITEIDSDILDRYFNMKQSLAEKKKPKKRTWVKWASLAACLCLMLVGSITYFMGNDTPEISSPNYPGYTEISSFYYEGDICDNEIASITHKGSDDTSITLSIDKKTTDPLAVAFRGWKSSNTEVIVSNAADLNFYINGEKADQIPIAPGKYEIIIDYSGFISKCDELDVMMYISDVGYFSLNNEGYIVDGIDGLPNLTMPE